MMREIYDLSDVKTKVDEASFDVPLATHEQVVQSGDDFYIISARDSQIIKELNDINPKLFVKYNKRQDTFILFAKEETREGVQEYLVKAFTQLDKRIVNRVKQISDPSYDFVAEGEKLDEELDKKKLYAIEQNIHDHAERLAHALRKDLGVKTHAFIGNSPKQLVSEDKEFLGGMRTKNA